ncbi:MAG: hypothetical protein LBT95_06720 [Treponema sp.]|jgi:hypothetical protein|nr:hypothetical protein [Treponema sp.]
MDHTLLSPLADDVFKAIFADQRNIDNLAALLRPVTRLPDLNLTHNSGSKFITPEAVTPF